MKTFKYVNVEGHKNNKALSYKQEGFFCGTDGTRTRDLRRDRAAF